MQSVFVLKLVRKLLQIAAIPFAIAAVGINAFIMHHPPGHADGPFGFWGYILIMLIVGGIAAGLSFLSRKLGQRVYDIEATTLYKEVVEGRREAFSVFLRPFYLTNKLVETSSSSPYDFTSYLKSPNSSLEVELVKAMRWTSPVVGLGRPGEALGVGRILTNEEDWKAAVTRLIDCAMYIFCIPSDHAGTLWEIDSILEPSLLAKTVFIMPPLPRPPPFFWMFSVNRSTEAKMKSELGDDWANLVIEMKKRGLSFPKYEKEGMLFSIKSAATIETRTFRLSSSRSIKTGVEALVTAQ